MGQIPITGYHAIAELLKHPEAGGTLLLSRENKRCLELAAAAAEHGIRVEKAPEAELDRLSGGDRHRGALFLAQGVPLALKQDLAFYLKSIEQEQALVVLLDGVVDPQNLGAVLRSADLFGVDLVVVTEHRAAHLTPAVAAASSGASAYVNLISVPNLRQAGGELKKANFWIYGADMDGARADQVKLTGRVALILGGEGRGLRRLVRESCDQLVAIPGRGHVDSFNVSVAAGILLYEIRRQQGFFDS
jgi:23S rRNA (guanosine2251-2'-O)-methyltransferase